ncbi:hypothetical protein [Magnetospirillum aberrantis]|uniref:Uncharacterized protein n=1 Tax=Magnetospirillum aberrantis SpK TaxID=908842 RepID=A0A7C9UZG5_9PROT|nr:hypothetical protein [Magnetospirillum aberrantis]NFV80334.1 hypothetical protein [Magnetospirillum aberrantis SpK]
MDFTLLAYAVIVAASVAIALRWRHDIPRAAVPLVRRRIDFEHHTLNLVSEDGRVNPGGYQVFPNYSSALAYQRKLARLGQASVVTHTESGEVRIDFPTMLGPFGRIYY